MNILSMSKLEHLQEYRFIYLFQSLLSRTMPGLVIHELCFQTLLLFSKFTVLPRKHCNIDMFLATVKARAGNNK